MNRPKKKACTIGILQGLYLRTVGDIRGKKLGGENRLRLQERTEVRGRSNRLK